MVKVDPAVWQRNSYFYLILFAEACLYIKIKMILRKPNLDSEDFHAPGKQPFPNWANKGFYFVSWKKKFLSPNSG